jgi:hypothetical protein
VEPLPAQQPPHINISSVALEPGIDFELIIPHKPRYGAFGYYIKGHKSADIISYMNTIRRRLAGSREGNDPGYLESTAIPPILQQLNDEMKAIMARYTRLAHDYLCNCEHQVLGTIIPDKASFDKTTQALREVLESVKAMLQGSAGS